MRTPANLILANPDVTANLAVSLGHLIRAGDTILLEGSLGAGKSHFARALIQHRLSELGVYEDVPSPTFTLVQTYDVGEFEIWHADLYRLSSPDEVLELGLDDAFEEAVTLIEWPDRLGELVPKNPCRIQLSTEMNHRRAVISWPDPRFEAWMSAFETVAKRDD